VPLGSSYERGERSLPMTTFFEGLASKQSQNETTARGTDGDHVIENCAFARLASRPLAPSLS